MVSDSLALEEVLRVLLPDFLFAHSIVDTILPGTHLVGISLSGTIIVVGDWLPVRVTVDKR